MKKELLGYYLYISWNNNREEKKHYNEFKSYMNVIKEIVKDDLSEKIQELGDQAFIFSSGYDFEKIREKISHKKNPYVLIDVSASFSTSAISCYLDEIQMGEIKEFLNQSKKDQVEYFKMRELESVEIQDFEKAVFYRDLLRNELV